VSALAGLQGISTRGILVKTESMLGPKPALLLRIGFQERPDPVDERRDENGIGDEWQRVRQRVDSGGDEAAIRLGGKNPKVSWKNSQVPSENQ
jgi:hypothetical protein